MSPIKKIADKPDEIEMEYIFSLINNNSRCIEYVMGLHIYKYNFYSFSKKKKKRELEKLVGTFENLIEAPYNEEINAYYQPIIGRILDSFQYNNPSNHLLMKKKSRLSHRSKEDY